MSSRGKGPRLCVFVRALSACVALAACSSCGADHSSPAGTSANAPDDAGVDATGGAAHAADSDGSSTAPRGPGGSPASDSDAGAGDAVSPAPDAALLASEGGKLSIVALGAGNDYECALAADGRVLCWGLDATAQLGLPSTYTVCSMTCRPWADAVENLSDARAIAVGYNHACALRSDGTVVCWGDNAYGELGVPSSQTQDAQCDSACSFAPRTIPGISGATAVSSGTNFSCAIVGGGAVECWGLPFDGTTAGSPTPVAMSGISGARAISAGDAHACAILSDGTVTASGNNQFGQLGDGTRTSSSTPVAVGGLKGAQAISAGEEFTCAVLSDGTVRCWGSNSEGQLGDGAPLPPPRTDPVQPFQTSPAVTIGLSNTRAVFAGDDYACALVGASSLECWGQANPIFVPNASPPFPDAGSQPYPDPNLTDVVTLAAGTTNACVLRATGAVHCFGDNSYGDMGNDYEGADLTGGPDIDVDFSQVP